MVEDFYELLGVPCDADVDTLKKAYRRLVKELHPDRNPAPAAEARFKAVSRAYAVLSDTKKRAAYDASSTAPRQRVRATKPTPPGAPRRVRVSHVTVDELVSTPPLRGPENGLEMLGSFFRKTRQDERGADRHATVTLSLGDSLRGLECDLEGIVSGSLVRLVVPAGAPDGSTVRVAGFGTPSPSLGPPGDLVVTVRIEPNARYRMVGHDLHLALPISLREAYSGARIEVPTPTGPIELRVPPRSQSGTVLRVKNRGAKAHSTAPPGHLFVRLEVQIPTSDDPKVATLIERLAALHNEPLREGLEL